MRALTTLAVLALAAVPTLAAQRAHQFEIGAFGSFTRYDRAFNLDNQIGGGGRLGYFFGRTVGIEVDLLRLRREQVGLLWAAPLQVVITTAIAGGAARIAGLDWFGAAIIGLAVALSSGVVIVNITRSRRRTTDPATDRALLGWSVLQDVTVCRRVKTR